MHYIFTRKITLPGGIHYPAGTTVPDTISPAQIKKWMMEHPMGKGRKSSPIVEKVEDEDEKAAKPPKTKKTGKA